MSILKAFNNHLGEFIDDLILLFPNDIDLKATKKVFQGLRKVNPKSLLINWKYYVTDKYKAEVYQGNIDFFLTKDYNNDMEDVEDKGEALKTIERLIKEDNDLENNINNLKSQILYNRQNEV